jgi:hypothetical protein
MLMRWNVQRQRTHAEVWRYARRLEVEHGSQRFPGERERHGADRGKVATRGVSDQRYWRVPMAFTTRAAMD